MATEAYDHAANELRLYAENTGELYPHKQKVLAIVRSRVARGDTSSATQLWRSWLEVAARRYQREIGPMHFSRATIDKVARELAHDFRTGEE